MNIRVYDINNDKRKINFIIREIIRNKHKNIRIYAHMKIELELVSSMLKFFPQCQVQHKFNYIEIKIVESNKEVINFYIASGVELVGEFNTGEEIKENIVILDSYKDTSIKLDQFTEEKIDVRSFCYGINDIQNKGEVKKTTNREEIKAEHIEHIKHSELRNKFFSIIENTNKRLDIMSPWINDIACDSKVLELLQLALERGVEVNIVYGIGKGDDARAKKSDEIANKLNRDYGSKGNLVINKKDSHYKAILSDDDISMCGSLNYLSCNPENTDSLEGADFIISSEIVNIKRQLYFDFGGENE